MRRHPAILLALLPLTGCLSVTTPPAPRVEAPETWKMGSDLPLQAAGTPWWSRFEHPGLEELIGEAMARNRDLAAAAARVDEAAALARIAGADLAPQVGLAVDAGRQRRNFLGFPIPDSGSRVLSTTSTSFGSSLNVSWEADLWGRLRAQRDGATAGAEASAAELEAARLSLAGQTAKAWFALVEAARQVELAEATLASRGVTRRQIERRFEAGLRGGVDLRLAIANEAGAEATLEGQRRRLDAARRQIELLVSAYPAGAPRPEAEALELPLPPPELPPGLPAELITRRPDLVALERRLAAAGLAIAQARAVLYPRLALTGSAGRLSQEIEDLLENDFSVWALAANLLQPLYQGGRLRAGVDLSEARYRQLAERYVQAVLRAFAEVESALVAERSLALQAEALEVAARQAAAAQRQAEQRYEAGLAPYLAVLEAQREAAASRGRLLSVRRQALDARVNLHLALGGDWAGAPDPTANEL